MRHHLNCTSEIYDALNFLFTESDEKIPYQINFDQLIESMPNISLVNKQQLWGSFNLLHTLGLITIDTNGTIKIATRQARLALGSISKFCKSSTQVVDTPYFDDLELQYLTQFTKAIEYIRINKPNIEHVNLHKRRFVNVIIKGKQIRDGKKQDVFLHVYHPSWDAYHLVGIGDKVGQSSEELAKRAIEIKIGLQPHQYELDQMIKINTFDEEFISGSLGVLTKYTIDIRVMKKIKVDLNFNDPKWNRNSFRWFSLQEINQGHGDNGEKILFSTPLIMRRIDTDSIPVSVSHIKNNREFPKLSEWINYRFTKAQQLILSIILLLSILMIFQPRFLLQFTKLSENQVQLFANYSQIVGTLISIISLLIIIFGNKE